MIKLCGEDPNVGALLITGAGTAFCAGGDVKGMGGKPGSSNAPELTFDQKVARLQERQRTLTGALVNVRKPTIAALPARRLAQASRWRWPATCASRRSPPSSPRPM